MAERRTESVTIVIAEDEQELADLYEIWLSQDYEIRTAYGGEEALELIDDSVDVVLLDRRMPDKSGDEVLAELRARAFDGPVTMVSAVDPDVDLLKMDYTDYVSKPVTQADLLELVSRMVTVAAQDPDVREYYELVAKKAALDSSQAGQDHAQADAYKELESRISTLRERIDLEQRVPDELKESLDIP